MDRFSGTNVMLTGGAAEESVSAAVLGDVDTPLTRTVAADDAPQLDFSYFDRIRSPMGPGTVEQLAGAIAFVASPDAAYLTGVDLRVDGGSHL